MTVTRDQGPGVGSQRQSPTIPYQAVATSISQPAARTERGVPAIALAGRSVPPGLAVSRQYPTQRRPVVRVRQTTWTARVCRPRRSHRAARRPPDGSAGGSALAKVAQYSLVAAPHPAAPRANSERQLTAPT